MKNAIKDFDRFIAEKEGAKMTVRILGRDIEVPSELPWHYVMKVERFLKGGEGISGAENIALLKQMLKPEDYEYITNHPEFRASWFWDLIAYTWLRAEDAPAKEPEFKSEDDVKVEASKPAKKKESAR